MHWIANILVGIGAAVAGLFGGAQHLAGTTITTILGTDTLSNSRTTINDNFTNLLNGKIESSTTTLPLITTLANLSTVGTIGSGVWQGTAVGAQYGGTGSTSLSANQVLLGNGTGAVSVVSGWGTSGMSLVSNGPGIKPSWQSISFDTTASYNLTGTYLGIKNLYASSTAANPLVLNTVSYNTPSTQGAASTTLWNDGSGNLRWQSLPATSLMDWTSPGVVINAFSSTASTTAYSTQIPANLLGATNIIHIHINSMHLALTNGTSFWLEVGYGNGTSTVEVRNTSGATRTGDGPFDLYIAANGATNSQYIESAYYGQSNGVAGSSETVSFHTTATIATDSTQAKQLVIVGRLQNADASNFQIEMMTVEIMKK